MANKDKPARNKAAFTKFTQQMLGAPASRRPEVALTCPRCKAIAVLPVAVTHGTTYPCDHCEATLEVQKYKGNLDVKLIPQESHDCLNGTCEE